MRAATPRATCWRSASPRAGHALKARAVVRFDKAAHPGAGTSLDRRSGIDIIVSNGGTGLTAARCRARGFRELFDKSSRDSSVLWHLVSYETVGVSTMQSRACAGIAGNTVIYVLPGSNGACRDGWDKLISLQIDSRQRPCSILESLPRFQKHR